MAEPMKIRAQMQGGVADVKVLMNHPMETGQRKDARTGQTIPAHFIQQVTVTVGGTPVLDVQWSQAISKNPFIGLRVAGAKAGDKVAVSWSDNKGEKNIAEATVAA